ncbi:hypothetical protein [Streptomyces sp. NPDC093990]|uniref:hypothetical protein n=1 Tax=Streptomyces sp. NPDC093990 TaxID=3155306 RepID=UPI0034492C10
MDRRGPLARRAHAAAAADRQTDKQRSIVVAPQRMPTAAQAPRSQAGAGIRVPHGSPLAASSVRHR